MKDGFLMMCALLLACETCVCAKIPALAVVADADLSPRAQVMTEQLREDLAKMSGCVLVEREQIARMMQEHALSLSGTVRSPVHSGQLLGANYLLYLQEFSQPSQLDIAYLLIEVSSGNVLVETRVLIPEASGDAAQRSQVLGDMASKISDAISLAEAERSIPSAVVVYVHAKTDTSQLSFLETSIHNMLEELLIGKGYRLLRRSHPEKLSSETTLGTMGMMRPDATVLAESAGLSLRANVEIKPSPDKAFEELPIALVLDIRQADGSAGTHQIEFTLASIGGLFDKLEPLVNRVGEPTTQTSQFDARREAASLMALLKPMYDDTAPFRDPLEVHQQQIELAQRIIYLDPTLKEPYYLLGMRLWGLRMSQWTPRSTMQRIVKAFKTYLQFPRTDFKKVIDAYSYIHACRYWIDSVWGDDFSERLAVYADYARWYAETAPPVNQIRMAREMRCSLLQGPWVDQEHIEEGIEWYEWLSALYDNKPVRGDIGRQLLYGALLSLQQGNKEKAADFLYRGVVTYAESLRLLTLANCNKDSDTKILFTSGLIEYLPYERQIQLQKRIDLAMSKYGPKPKHAYTLRDLYGDFGTIASYHDIYAYSYHADDDLLAMRKDIREIQPERVRVGEDILYTDVAKTTESGVWMQGRTLAGKFVLLHSPVPGDWRLINFDFEGKTMPPVIRIEQDDNNIIFAALHPDVPHAEGLYSYNIQTGEWSHIGVEQGLLFKYVINMCPDNKRAGLWLNNMDRFSRYADGRIFIDKPTDKMTLQLFGQKSQSYDSNRIHGCPLTPRYMYMAPRSYGSCSYIFCRRELLNGCLYVATPGSLTCFSETEMNIWYPDYFCYDFNTELGAFVKGNCPLPPVKIQELVKDDVNPDLLWIISDYGGAFPYYDPHQIMRIRAPTNISDQKVKETLINKEKERGGRQIITAFNTKTRRFSLPLMVPPPTFVHIAPRGDRLYLTGWNLGWLPKELWKTDQETRPDGSVEIMHADTPFGRAAAHLVKDDVTAAIKELESVTNSVTRAAAESAIRHIRALK